VLLKSILGIGYLRRLENREVYDSCFTMPDAECRSHPTKSPVSSTARGLTE